MKAVEMSPKQEFTSSGPVVSAPKGGAAAKHTPPVSYPSSSAANAASKPYAASSPKAAGVGGPAGHPNNYKWAAWEEIYDAENTAYYYFNHSNGESLWEPPAGWPHAARV